MKISILLPLKENFSPSYAGAVSLFVNDTLEYSKFKKEITVFGQTKFKKNLIRNITISALINLYFKVRIRIMLSNLSKKKNN